MPHIKAPTHFPGADRLPAPVRGLMEFFYPPEDIMPVPTPLAPAGQVGARITSAGKKLWGVDAKPGRIAKDPYAIITDKPIDRRQFIDRATGGPGKRVNKDLQTVTSKITRIGDIVDNLPEGHKDGFIADRYKGGRPVSWLRKMWPGEKELRNKAVLLDELSIRSHANPLIPDVSEIESGPVLDALRGLLDRFKK